MENFLIVGLGNPGKKFDFTRHNIGFEVVKALASKNELEFKKEKKFNSEIAKGKILDLDVILLLPQTYMNLSGEAVKKVVNYYKIDPDKILVIVDDADIDLKKFKIQTQRSSAGHKGLQSIEDLLNTNKYHRLRVGVGPKNKELEIFVLEKFTKEEMRILPQIIDKSVFLIETWLKNGIAFCANIANIKSLKNNEEKNG